MSVSFGFTKKKEQRVLQTSAIGDKEKAEPDEKAFLTTYDKKTGKASESKELVIPLIQNNLWRNAKRPNEGSDKTEERASKKSRIKEPGVELEGEDAAAAKELIEEAEVLNEDWEYRDGISAPDMTIPILMRNKVPDGFETDDKLDVSLRPEGATEVNYEEVPVQSFGKAMLRGMGWTEGSGIGKDGKVVAPINAVLRPKGMGLGADRSLVEQLKSKKGGKSNGKNEEKLELKNGAYCIITSGKHANYYGQVQGLDEDNQRAFVKVTITGEKISISQLKLQLVTSEDYKKNSKYINKSKADEYHKETERKLMEKYEAENGSRKHKHRDHDDKHTDRHRDRKSHKHNYDSDRSDSEDYNDRDYDKKSSKHRDKDNHSSKDDKSSSRHKDSKHDRGGSKLSKSSNSESTARVWLRPKLRVRIIDEKFKKGKYYKEKVVVEDVISGQDCICQTDDGKLLEGLNQDMLETVIPKSVPSTVMIVSGPHRNKLGELVNKDKSNYIATIQVLPDRDEVLQIDFDSICDYTGDTHTELDY